MHALRVVFAGHPWRIAAASVLLAFGAAAFWYLASPLWVRTERHEELPAAAPPAVGAATSAGATPAGTAAPAVVTLSRGELGYVDQIHNGKGQVLVVQTGSQRLVRFENVAITNAPDVHVYLSKDAGGTYVSRNTLYLGPLKATNGSFNYEVPAGADVSEYRSVVVWCRAFSVLITWTDLRP